MLHFNAKFISYHYEPLDIAESLPYLDNDTAYIYMYISYVLKLKEIFKLTILTSAAGPVISAIPIPTLYSVGTAFDTQTIVEISNKTHGEWSCVAILFNLITCCLCFDHMVHVFK